WAGTVENGQTYYYAVCSYDKGYYIDFFDRGLSEFDSLQPHAPAVCEKKIQFDASGAVTFLDVNTVEVIPDAPAAGYIDPPDLTSDNGWIKKIEGYGTGKITVQPLDPIKIDDGVTYEVIFDDSSHYDSTQNIVTDTTFFVKDERIHTEIVKCDTNWTLLKRKHLVPSSIVVKLLEEDVVYQEGVDFQLGFKEGNFRALPDGSMPITNKDNTYYAEVSYQYYTIYDSPFINGEDRNDYFDGLCVLVNNHKLEASNERSKWLKGDELQHYLANYGFIGENDPIPESNKTPSNYMFEANLYANQGVKVPYDFHIVIYDSIVTKAKNNKWANFRVFNITTDDTADFVFFDTDADSVLSDQDYLTPTTLVKNRVRGTWQVKFWAPKDIIVTRDSLDERGYPVRDKEDEIIKINVDTIFVEKIPPKPGDIFHLAVNKPFNSEDKFTFTAQAPQVDYEKAHNDNSLRKIAVVPNPYIVTASWEPQHFYTSGRGIRKIDFIHLPPKCTIKIFTLRGYLVDTVEHDSPITDGSESWNMLSKDGMEIAYGVYLFHVETPTGESTVGKFAVIK
ncbi:MAG: hypothetical protein JSW07_05855, partial [bacterium]